MRSVKMCIRDSNYDEYHFDLDDIEHDPYVLISILSALHEGEFTLDEVQGTCLLYTSGTGRTQDQPVGVLELLAVHHDHVVGQRIQQMCIRDRF